MTFTVGLDKIGWVVGFAIIIGGLVLGILAYRDADYDQVRWFLHSALSPVALGFLIVLVASIGSQVANKGD